jgi:UDPglucose 6-dehydrogenase
VLCDSSADALDGADALAVVTEWQEFRSPDFAKIRAALAEPVIVDGRNIYDPQVLEDQGFIYYGIGRGRSAA